MRKILALSGTILATLAVSSCNKPMLEATQQPQCHCTQPPDGGGKLERLAPPPAPMPPAPSRYAGQGGHGWHGHGNGRTHWHEAHWDRWHTGHDHGWRDVHWNDRTWHDTDRRDRHDGYPHETRWHESHWGNHGAPYGGDEDRYRSSHVAITSYSWHSDSHVYHEDGPDDSGYAEDAGAVSGTSTVGGGWRDGYGRYHNPLHLSPRETAIRLDPWHGYDKDCDYGW